MFVSKSLLSRRTVLSAAAALAFGCAAGLGGHAAMSQETHTLKLASEAGDKGSPVANSMDLWAKLIEDNSGGRIKVQVFYQGQLGGQQELFDQLVKGNVDMMLTWPITSYDPRLGIMNTPYLVLDWNDALEAYKPGGWLVNLADPVFAGIGLKYFGPWPEGFVGVATKGKYATSIEAAKEIKVRSQPIFPFPQAMQALGYQAVPIDWDEVYTSIQTGVVDGDSGNIIYWDYVTFKDIVDHYVYTRHLFSTGALVMNRSSWDSLDDEAKKIVADAASVAIEKQFQGGKATDEDWRKKATDGGMTFVELTPAEFAAAVEAVRGKVWAEMEEKVGKYLMDELRSKASTPPKN